MTRLGALLLALFLVAAPVTHAQSEPTPQTSLGDPGTWEPLVAVSGSQARAEVTYANADLTLHGFLYRPVGDGPFPAVVYNHGSEKDPRPYLDALARVFTSRGFAFMAPFRRGHASSPGPYIVDQLNAASPTERDALLVHLHEAQVADQLAGLDYLKRVAFVDPTRIVVTGASFGGIQTILGAEANPGYRAAIDCAGAAQTWASSPALRLRLVNAISNIQIPVLLIQAENDYDTRPSRTLASELERLGKPYRIVIYPPFGTGSTGEEGHSVCGPRGAGVWGSDVFDFINAALAS